MIWAVVVLSGPRVKGFWKGVNGRDFRRWELWSERGQPNARWHPVWRDRFKSGTCGICAAATLHTACVLATV